MDLAFGQNNFVSGSYLILQCQNCVTKQQGTTCTASTLTDIPNESYVHSPKPVLKRNLTWGLHLKAPLPLTDPELVLFGVCCTDM